MDFLIENWYLILAALVSGTALAWPALTGAGAAGVSASQAVQLVNREKGVVVDVCDDTEFAAGHVVGARHIPLATLPAATTLPTDKSLPLVVVCQSGVRATRAAGMLRKQGYANVRVLTGGLKAWREAGLPLESGAATAASVRGDKSGKKT